MSHPAEYVTLPNCSCCGFPSSASVRTPSVDLHLCRRCAIEVSARVIVEAHVGVSGRPAAGMIARMAAVTAEQVYLEGRRLLRERGRLEDLPEADRDQLRIAAAKRAARADRQRPRREALLAMRREEAVVPLGVDPEEEQPRRPGRRIGHYDYFLDD